MARPAQQVVLAELHRQPVTRVRGADFGGVVDDLEAGVSGGKLVGVADHRPAADPEEADEAA